MIFNSSIIEIAGVKYARIPKALADDQEVAVGKCKVEESGPNEIKITFG